MDNLKLLLIDRLKMKFQINKKSFAYYKSTWNQLACANCLVKVMCFSDPINSLTSENMPCNIELKDPCAGAFLKIHLIELTGSNNLVMSVDAINRLKTNELFETAELYDAYKEPNHTKTASLIFLTLIDREPDFIYNTAGTAYYYIGKYCRHIFKEIKLAIQMFTMDIELTNDMYSLAERGYCYYKMGKKDKALADFKMALSMSLPNEMKKNIELMVRKLERLKLIY